MQTRKVSSTHLLNELKIKSGTNINETTALSNYIKFQFEIVFNKKKCSLISVKEKMNETDAEIATTSLRVSLVCPLGKMRMITPCRLVEYLLFGLVCLVILFIFAFSFSATTCLHLQCFDAALYLEMNEMKQTFICPVCDKKALYENLVIDEYFQQVLNSSSLSADDHDIELKKDGSWTKCCDKIVIFNLDLSQESQSKLDDNSAIVLIPYIDCELLPKKSCNVTSEFIDLTVNTPVKPTTHRRTRSSTTVDLTFGDSDN